MSSRPLAATGSMCRRLSSRTRVRKVEEAGGIAVVIPPRLDSADDDHRLVRTLLGRLDGVIIAGGADVAPELYEAKRCASVQARGPTGTRLRWPLPR